MSKYREETNYYQIEVELVDYLHGRLGMPYKHVPHALIKDLGARTGREAISTIRSCLEPYKDVLTWYSNFAENYYRKEGRDQRILFLIRHTYIDLLIILPEFRDKVATVRSDFDIEPLDYLTSASLIIPDTQMFLRAKDYLHDPYYFEHRIMPLIERQNQYLQKDERAVSYYQIQECAERVTNLEKKICRKRAEILGNFEKQFRLNRSVRQWIFDYLLYDIRQGSVECLGQYKEPELRRGKDDQGENYLELKIYDDTDALGWLRAKANKAIIQEVRGDYIGASNWKNPKNKNQHREGLIRELAYCEQILLHNKNNIEANEFLIENGVLPVTPSRHSMTIKRYKNRLLKNHP